MNKRHLLIFFMQNHMEVHRIEILRAADIFWEHLNKLNFGGEVGVNSMHF